MVGAVDELRARVDAASLPEEERVSALEFGQYLGSQMLRDTDAVSMHHSLEVRTPLVDRELLERAFRGGRLHFSRVCLLHVLSEFST